MQILLVQSTEAPSEAVELGRSLARELGLLPELDCRFETVGASSEPSERLQTGALARLAGGALELPRDLLRVRNLARDWKPEIVHALSGPALLPAVLAARAAGAALVIPAEDEATPSWAERAVRAGLGQLGLEQTWRLARSREAGDRLVECGAATGERVRVVRPGIAAFEGPPARRRAMRDTWCVDDGELLVGTVGPLLPGQGLETLLEAVARGQETAPAAGLEPRLALVGSGPHEAALRKTARRLKLGARVIVAPPPPRLQDAFAAFDLYVQPGERSEAGLDCLRAMASGLAVVASRVEGLDDLVADRVTGLLIQPGNSSLLGETIWRLGLAPDERIEMGRMGRLRVETYFEAGRMAREVAQVYAEAARQAMAPREATGPDR